MTGTVTTLSQCDGGGALDPEDRPLALAGLWTGRRGPETGEWHRTFTIVTTRPNAFMTPIHARMPVVVPPDAWARWLDPTPAEPGELRAIERWRPRPLR
jgi:putative SOS response-associated peptidase YedK